MKFNKGSYINNLLLIIFFMICFSYYSCEEDPPEIEPPNPNPSGNFCYSGSSFQVEIVESMVRNPVYRPLHNNPLPLGTLAVQTVFAPCNFQSYVWNNTKSPADPEVEIALDHNNPVHCCPK